MRVSYRWLQEFAELPWAAEEVAEVLNRLGLEVEAIEDLRGAYAGIQIGYVRAVEVHPQSERLRVCRISSGGEELTVVVGTSAIAEGQRVVVARPGAYVPGLQQRIEPRLIAGVRSEGMLCSQRELGIGAAEAIWVLPEDAPIGAPLAAYLPELEDVLYDVAITPNRGDCLSHLGIARELAAYGGIPVRLPQPEPVEETEALPAQIALEAPEGCPYYTCRQVEGAVAVTSPLWMQLRLLRLGLQPHSLAVDVMNYVMLEQGQPLHAFDADTIAGQQIHVRWAHSGERFCGLDGQERELHPQDLLIADVEKPLALAGVLGGANSAVTAHTRRVLIESALFSPVHIRRTARRHGLETEAAYRFQRGVDPTGVLRALERAATLLAKLSNGVVSRPAVADLRQSNSRIVRLRYERVGRILGITLPREQIEQTLQRLSCTVVSRTEEDCNVIPPPYRNDLHEEIDLVEEIARLYGYERIPAASSALLPLELQPLPPELAPSPLVSEVIQMLSHWGLQQVFTVVLSDPESARIWTEHPVELVNPLSQEYSVLRPSLVPALARVLAHNVRVGERTVRIFEIGKVFSRRAAPVDALPYEEEQRVGILLSGAAVPLQWGLPQREVDLYDLRGIVEQLLEALRVAGVRWEPMRSRPAVVTPAAVELYAGERRLGWLGELRPSWLRRLEVEQPAFVAELSLPALQACRQPAGRYEPVPEFPAIRRDLAFVVDASVPVVRLQQLIEQNGGEWLEEVVLFDVFTSPALGEGKRSVAFSLRFRSRQRTLREEELEPILQRIIAEVEQHTGARLRR